MSDEAAPAGAKTVLLTIEEVRWLMSDEDLAGIAGWNQFDGYKPAFLRLVATFLHAKADEILRSLPDIQAAHDAMREGRDQMMDKLKALPGDKGPVRPPPS